MVVMKTLLWVTLLLNMMMRSWVWYGKNQWMICSNESTIIWGWTCVLLNNDSSVRTFIINSLGTLYGICLCLNEYTELGYFISANNVLFLDLEDGYYWTLHFELNSNILVEIWCFEKKKTFLLFLQYRFQ